MTLNDMRGITSDGNTLDYIGIKRTLSEEPVVAVFVGAVFLVFSQ
jgi:hypothetical protein